MLYWKPNEVRAYLRRWTLFKALIATLMLTLPAIPMVDSAISELGVFRSTTMLVWYAIAGAVWLWGCGDYAKSKGYSAWWGMLCAPLPLGPFGLFALFLFPDRWDPRFNNWSFESSPLLIDGERMPSSKAARLMLKSSWVSRLAWAAGLWIVVLGITLVATKQVSLGTSETLKVIALALAAIACSLGIWGGAHLARYKGYKPYWAGVGFFTIPAVMTLLLTSSGSFAILALTLIAFLLGPVVLLLMPDQWSDIGISPIQYNPNELRDTVEPQFAHLHDVRILNTY